MDEATLQSMLGPTFVSGGLAWGMSQEAFADPITMHRAYYSKVERGEEPHAADDMARNAGPRGQTVPTP